MVVNKKPFLSQSWLKLSWVDRVTEIDSQCLMTDYLGWTRRFCACWLSCLFLQPWSLFLTTSLYCWEVLPHRPGTGAPSLCHWHLHGRSLRAGPWTHRSHQPQWSKRGCQVRNGISVEPQRGRCKLGECSLWQRREAGCSKGAGSLYECMTCSYALPCALKLTTLKKILMIPTIWRRGEKILYVQTTDVMSIFQSWWFALKPWWNCII